MTPNCGGDTIDGRLCSGDLEATWYWSNVGELIFRVLGGGGGGSSTGAPYPLLLLGLCSEEDIRRVSGVYSGAGCAYHCVGGGALLLESDASV